MDVCFCIQPGPFQKSAKRSISGFRLRNRTSRKKLPISILPQGPCEPAGVKTEADVSRGRKKGDKKRYMFENDLGPETNEKAKVNPSYIHLSYPGPLNFEREGFPCLSE